MKKKRFLIAIVLLFVIVGVLSLVYVKVTGDPNYLMKKSAVRISEGKTRKASYDYGKLVVIADRKIPVYEFVPGEAAEYEFEVTDFRSETGDMLVMNVVDRSFSEYLAAVGADEEGQVLDAFSDKAFLQKGRRYYIFLDAVSESSSRLHEGSFRITVKKSEEDIRPAEITEDQTVRLEVKQGEQGSLLFKPAESGYYRFDSDIVSKNAASGFSQISGITAADSDEILITDNGICRLDGGTEYTVLVSVEDIEGRSAKVDVRCSSIASGEFDENGTIVIDTATVIEYTADENGGVIIYSESEGDPEITIYDSKGFPLRSDDDSGEEFGGASEDFAVVFKAKSGSKYYLFVSGKFSECKVSISGYNADMGESEEEDPEASDESADQEMQEEQ